MHDMTSLTLNNQISIGLFLPPLAGAVMAFSQRVDCWPLRSEARL
jgi:hypothetical protein